MVTLYIQVQITWRGSKLEVPTIRIPRKAILLVPTPSSSIRLVDDLRDSQSDLAISTVGVEMIFHLGVQLVQERLRHLTINLFLCGWTCNLDCGSLRTVTDHSCRTWYFTEYSGESYKTLPNTPKVWHWLVYCILYSHIIHSSGVSIWYICNIMLCSNNFWTLLFKRYGH